MPDHRALLGPETETFAAIVGSTDPDAPVAYCPGWRVRDLVDHLGGIHRWARHAVEAGSPDLEPEPMPGLETADALALADWYLRQARDLREALGARAPGSSAWTMDPDDPTVGFWWRRQVHESRLHRWDLELAGGGPTTPYDAALAWDGVLEVVRVFCPRQVRLGRIEPLEHPLRLVATDGGWSAVLDGRNRGAAADSGREVLEVRATAEVLLRLLWHRADPEAEGVDPRAAAVLALAVTP